MDDKPQNAYPFGQKASHFLVGFFGWFVVTSFLFVFYESVLDVLGMWPLGGASWYTGEVRNVFLIFTALNILITTGISWSLYARRYWVIVGMVTVVILNQIVWLMIWWPLVTIGVPFWIIGEIMS